MSILAKNNSNNKSTNTVSITTNKMTAKFFKQLLLKSLGRREQALDLINCFAESLSNNIIVSPYKSCAELLKDHGLNPKDTGFNESFTILKKLGIILKHNNRYSLNPLVEEKATSRSYELAVEYYNLLFKDIAFEFKTLDELKMEAACDYRQKLSQKADLIDLDNSIYAGRADHTLKPSIKVKLPEEYLAIFNSPKKSLNTSNQVIWNGVSDAYRNICGDYITEMLMKHVEMFKEQGVVEINWGKWNRPTYTFNRITLEFQKTLVPFTATKTYQDSIPSSDAELTAELFQDTKQQMLQQFEEEDFQADYDDSRIVNLPDEHIYPSTQELSTLKEIETLFHKQTRTCQAQLTPLQKEILDAEVDRKIAEITTDYNANKPKQIIDPYRTLTDPDEINAVVSKIRQEGRFPTKEDCLPLDIDIQLSTEAHNAWRIQQKPIWAAIERAKQLELAQKIGAH